MALLIAGMGVVERKVGVVKIFVHTLRAIMSMGPLNLQQVPTPMMGIANLYVFHYSNNYNTLTGVYKMHGHIL